MIITCPCGEKKFEVDSSLIPEKGKLLQCGSCDKTWFFKKNEQVNIEKEILQPKNYHQNEKENEIPTNKDDNLKKIKEKNYQITKYKKKSTFGLNKFLSYVLVLIISFVAAIVIIDTFKSPLYEKFPNLEVILFSLFETLKDVKLFIKDLI